MTGATAHTITKSRYLQGLQCLKFVWTVVHRPDLIPAPDEAARHRFTEGYVIDRLAKEQFPGGETVPSDDFLKNLDETRALLPLRRPIFEAGFKADDLSARADILNPAGKGSWDIIEVKSSTAVKAVHLQDVAFQRHCYQAAGVKIRKTFLMHVAAEYVRHGELEPGKLLVMEDITRRTAGHRAELVKTLAPIRRALASPTRPEVDIGPHCTAPYDCPLRGECWAFLPEHDVFSLYRGGEKSLALYRSGVQGLADIPAETELTERQTIQIASVKSGRPHVDRPRIGEFLKTLQYPLSFLDFESFAAAVPLFDGVHAYQSIPFQYSLHVIDAPAAAPTHHAFLAEGAADPQPAFLKALKQELPDRGSVIVYNRSFEAGVLAALGQSFPVDAAWVKEAIQRLVDLLIPFRSFQYYHPRQHGSASLKAVLPALTGAGYEGLGIADGQAASREYLHMTHGEFYGARVSEDEKRTIRRDLLEYCGLDTEAMIRIVRELERAAGGA